MKTIFRKILATTALCLAAEASVSCTVTTPTLPALQNSIPAGFTHTAGISMPLGDTRLSFEYHRKAEDTCLLVRLEPDSLPKDCQLRLSVSGEPYNTARGKEWKHDFSTLHKPGEYIFLLRKRDFPREGGPYDYRVVFTLLSADGKALECRYDRLEHSIPGPGWEASYEVEENQKELKKLQQAATRCAGMRLQMTYHWRIMTDAPVELPLNTQDIETLRNLIKRMRPVKTYVHEVLPAYQLQLLLHDAQGNKLATMDPYDVVSEEDVSPENLADLSTFALSAEDVAAWFRIINSPEVEAAIDSADKNASNQR